MSSIQEYYLKKQYKDDIYIVEKGFHKGINIKNAGIKIFHHTGCWLFPFEYFNLNKTKKIK
jgi:hypothetical protein